MIVLDKLKNYKFTHFEFLRRMGIVSFYLILYVIFFFLLRIFINKHVKLNYEEILSGTIYYIPETKIDIYWYFSLVFFTFIYVFLTSFLVFKSNFFNSFCLILKQLSKKKIGLFTLLFFMLLFVSFDFSLLEKYCKILLPIYIFIYFYPPFFSKINIFLLKITNFLKPEKIIYGVFGVSAALSLFIFKPFVYDQLKVVDEFYDIPTTIINNGEEHIDFDKYINDNYLNGIRKKSNFYNYNEYSKDYCVYLREPELLRKYVKSGGIISRINSAYTVDGDEFCIWELPDNDSEILELLPNANDLKEVNLLLMRLKVHDNLIKNNNKKHRKEIKSFIKKYMYQVHWQILSRGFIHHHNHLMSPMNDLELGRPLDAIFAQYGLLQSYVIKEILKQFNSFDYNGLQKILFISYIIYILSLIVISSNFTKYKFFSLNLFVFIVFTIMLLSFQYLYLGPGFALPRHFFDVFLVFFSSLYLSKKNIVYLLIADLLCVLSVLNNGEFGLALLISFMGILFVKRFSNLLKCDLELFSSLIVFTICLLLYFKISSISSSDKVVSNFLSGSLAFPIPIGAIVFVICYIILSYLVFIAMRASSYKNAYSYLLLTFYLQGLTVYWFRSYALYHFLPFAPIVGFHLLILFDFICERYKLDSKRFNTWIAVILFVLICVNIVPYNKSLREFQRVFENSVTYEWNYPHTNFVSTMNPNYFNDSVRLINDYSNNDKGVVILSKYDSILPLISEKYSTLPFIDVQWYLVRPKDKCLVANSIISQNKEYIFVDKDFINRSFMQDIVPISSQWSYLHEESVWRAQRLYQMQHIYRLIHNYYTPIASSKLLTVLKRNNKQSVLLTEEQCGNYDDEVYNEF